MDVVVPYIPRHFQDEVHKAIDVHRFSVVVCHRRAGKSVLAVNHIIKKAITCKNHAPKYAYVAPFLKQAKLIAWDYLKYYTKSLPRTDIHEGELYIELINGARVYIFGADNPDALRGLYLDGVVLDEYADIKQEVFNEIIRPALADRNGWALFLGTPKGQNHFYELFLSAQKRHTEGDKDWYACLYRADETKVISDKELLELKNTLTDSAYRQEFLCSFDASCDNILIDIDLVTDSMSRNLQDEDFSDYPVIMAVDPARFGDDSSVVVWKRGQKIYKPRIYKKIDNMTLVGNISRLADEMQPKNIFIDAGHGAGVIDRLRQLNYSVVEVHFGERPIHETRYYNKRAEMWDNLRLWMKNGGQLPNDTTLKMELTSVTYDYNAKNQMRLEAKQDVKDRLGRSPDIADACALLFAYPYNTLKADAKLQREALK